jgi:hypothetical protein
MSEDIKKYRGLNLLVVGILVFITLFTAAYEGYLVMISLWFWLALALAVVLTVFLAHQISTLHLVSLAFSIYVVEYVKEATGIRSGMWTYNGIDNQFTFGVWCWVLVGLSCYFLATRVVSRFTEKIKIKSSGLINVIITFVIFSLIPLTLGDYSRHAGIMFYALYVFLLIVSIQSVYRMRFSTFAAIVITAWIMSNPSEYVGAISSGTWTFKYSPDYPPLFLLLGCWPLELITQYKIASIIAREDFT